MKLVPNSWSRYGHRSLLKLNAGSPTILVVAGVVGLGATAVLAARAGSQMDPVIEKHQKRRAELEGTVYSTERDRQKALIKLYMGTSVDLGKLYGPTIFVGATSAIAVLGGHKILHGRQLATMAAYSGLLEQFGAYRKRVALTLGEDVERGIFEGARGEWVEDPDHKGEYKLEPKFDEDAVPDTYLRPWFDEGNVNFRRDPVANYAFLKGVQTHMNHLLQIRGHVMLSDVYDALGFRRNKQSIIGGWIYHSTGDGRGDNHVDFGFMTGIDPHTVAFRNGEVPTVRLNFNIDGDVHDLIR